MATLYKLTTQNNLTRAGYNNQCEWGLGVTHRGTGVGKLCSAGFIHAYTSPLLAILLNPIHANIRSPKLWEAEGDIVKSDHGLKVGCVSLTTIRELPVPDISITQKIAFAILCAKSVCKDVRWSVWADRWLSSDDRSRAAAARAAHAAAYAAAYAADAADADIDFISLAEQAMKYR